MSCVQCLLKWRSNGIGDCGRKVKQQQQHNNNKQPEHTFLNRSFRSVKLQPGHSCTRSRGVSLEALENCEEHLENCAEASENCEEGLENCEDDLENCVWFKQCTLTLTQGPGDLLGVEKQNLV